MPDTLFNLSMHPIHNPIPGAFGSALLGDFQQGCAGSWVDDPGGGTSWVWSPGFYPGLPDGFES